MSRRWPRAVIAAALLTIVVGALLGAWFASAWADVRARQRAVRDAPAAAADHRGAELAHALRGELAGVLAREVERPYFHYQNLFHDPRGSAGPSVAPSPLARGSDEALVAGYFQLDGKGGASTPTINDELPALSEPRHLAEHRRFRDEVTRSLASALAPRAAEVVAAAAQVIPRQQQVDRNTYAQNAVSNAIFRSQQVAPALPPAPAPAAMPVAVTVSPLAWRTLPFAGQPAIVAVRRVDTPDGSLAQGFVIDRSALTGWLAARAGDAVVALVPGDDGSTEIVPGWHLEVAANPRAALAAAAEASSLARGFVARFVAAGVVAILAAVLVVLLVSRAERLARERSQFAAAAAHELRTPLAGLQLYGDMLADGLGDPAKLRDYARRMSEEASRLGRVVSNVLGFSQLERGNLSVEPARGDLSAALRELAERAEPALDRAGCGLALEVAPGLGAAFDRDALARIIGNLLDNAEKYSRQADDRTITLAARAAGAHVEIAVTDHGPGVAPGARLFRAFARGVSPDGPAGLGLGLALSQSLARAMGGELGHRASPRGATFVLTLAA
ncbi:MAG TPA: HAMP domain-containing sensor histidine kinase [Kofleriaceae bacterium]